MDRKVHLLGILHRPISPPSGRSFGGHVLMPAIKAEPIPNISQQEQAVPTCCDTVLSMPTPSQKPSTQEQAASVAFVKLGEGTQTRP